MSSNGISSKKPLTIDPNSKPPRLKSSSKSSVIEGSMPKREDKQEAVSDKPVKRPQKYNYSQEANNLKNVDPIGAAVYIKTKSIRTVLNNILNKWSSSLHTDGTKDKERDDETEIGEELLLQELFKKVEIKIISTIFNILPHSLLEIKNELDLKIKSSPSENNLSRTRINSIHSHNQIVFPESFSHTPLAKKSRPTIEIPHSIEKSKFRPITDAIKHLEQKAAVAYIEKNIGIKELIIFIFYKIGRGETLETDEIELSRTILHKIHSTHIMRWCNYNDINLKNLKQIFDDNYPLQIKKKNISTDLNPTTQTLTIISNHLNEIGFKRTLNYLNDENIKDIILMIFDKINRLNHLTWHEKNLIEILFNKFEANKIELEFIFNFSNNDYIRIQNNFESIKSRENRIIKKNEKIFSMAILSTIRNYDSKGTLIYINHKKEVRSCIEKVFLKIKNKEIITRDEYSLAVGISTKFGHHETLKHFDFDDNLIENITLLSNAESVFNLNSPNELKSDKEKEVSKVPNIQKEKTEQEILETKLAILSTNDSSFYNKHLNQIIEELKLFDGALDIKEVLEHKKEILYISDFKDFIDKFFIRSLKLFHDNYKKEMKKRNLPIEPNKLIDSSYDGAFIELLTAWQYSLCYPVEEVEPYIFGAEVDFQCKIKSETATTKEKTSHFILPFDVFIGPLGVISNESWLEKYISHVSKKGNNTNTVGVFDATFTSNSRLNELNTGIRDMDSKLVNEKHPIRRTVLRVPLAHLALDRTKNKIPLAEIKSESEIREEKRAFAKLNTRKIIANLNNMKQLQKKEKSLFKESLEHLSENDIRELKSRLKSINTKQAKDLLKYFDDSPSKS